MVALGFQMLLPGMDILQHKTGVGGKKRNAGGLAPLGFCSSSLRAGGSGFPEFLTALAWGSASFMLSCMYGMSPTIWGT
jgi:hypothetical protein